MADVESQIMARELGKLAGIGAKWVARFLPSVPRDGAGCVSVRVTTKEGLSKQDSAQKAVERVRVLLERPRHLRGHEGCIRVSTGLGSGPGPVK